MVRDQEARLAKEQIERKVFNAVVLIPSRVDGERAVPQNCDIPDIANESLWATTVHRRNLGVHRCHETIPLQDLRTC